MPYRGPNPERQRQQTNTTVMTHAGNTATWMQYISASGGIPAAGIGATAFWREQLITAVFSPAQGQPEEQTPGGMLADAELTVVTEQQLGRNDRLIWRGVEYRVDSDPQPSKLNDGWISLIKRGDP